MDPKPSCYAAAAWPSCPGNAHDVLVACFRDETHKGHEGCMVRRDDGEWECYMCCAHLAPRDMDVLLPCHKLRKLKDKGKGKYRKTIT